MTGPPQPQPGGVLGVDVGTVRVGIASSDETLTVASPLAVLRRDRRDFWQWIGALLQERRVEMVVVGLPLRSGGDEGAAAMMARAFAQELRHRSGCETVFWDERFTSAQAERSLIEAGQRRARRRQVVDAVAAALLLQSWLDHRRRHVMTT